MLNSESLIILQEKPDAGRLIIATYALLVASTTSLLIVCNLCIGTVSLSWIVQAVVKTS